MPVIHHIGHMVPAMEMMQSQVRMEHIHTAYPEQQVRLAVQRQRLRQARAVVPDQVVHTPIFSHISLFTCGEEPPDDALKRNSRKENYMKDKSYWIKWIKAAGVRAVKTMAQSAVGLIGTSVMIADVSWKVVASASLLAGIVSLLTSIAGLPEVQVENTDLPL